ncbi:hypothetical protein GOP47_0012407 [Adiantum capillus-veneris]|uniref:Enoyl-CoA hydratase n=1 Tax=Adiantum capillus-veneris TaxID=13818 RepID=A0A9D4URA7_ADICA|nr:hypothetical protein GOP47_0012407 [Adiantum capillus-veneris]
MASLVDLNPGPFVLLTQGSASSPRPFLPPSRYSHHPHSPHQLQSRQQPLLSCLLTESNTWTVLQKIQEEMTALNADSDVKVIILTGAGRAFCSGVDLTAAQDVFKGDVKNREIDPVIQMEACTKPIIGAINGFAVTAGFEIALACDILVASKDAKFIDTHCKFGIFPSWGLSQKLPRIIGLNRAKEISWSAKPLDAITAERWGLVNKVVESREVLEAAIGVGEDIIKNQQDMVVRYKGVINDGFKLSLGDGAVLEKVSSMYSPLVGGVLEASLHQDLGCEDGSKYMLM